MGKQNETRKETNIIKEMLELIACVVVAFSITWGGTNLCGRTNKCERKFYVCDIRRWR